MLTVSAQRTYEQGEEDEILVSERPQGRFSRQLFLGEGLDRNQSLLPTIRASSPSSFPWRRGRSLAGSRSVEAEALRQSKPKPFDSWCVSKRVI